MERLSGALFALALVAAAVPLSAAVCPTTANTNTDCGYILTIGAGGAITGAAVAGANPYDGSDDALIGVINNSGSVYTGSITLSGSGNGGGLFGFDGDGICAYTGAAYCATAPTGYEGPLNTFSGISPDTATGTVNISGLGVGATTFFSLEGSPASISGPITIVTGSPEPGTVSMLGLGLAAVVFGFRKRRASALKA